jgi:protein SCO1/2
MTLLKRTFFLALSVVIISVGLGIWHQSRQDYLSAPLLSATEIDPMALPPFMLQNTKGGIIDNKALKGSWTFLYFGYTSCPDICPATLGKLKAVAEGLDPKDNTRFIFISADPKRDNLENLEAYVTAFSDRFEGGLGSHEEVTQLAKKLFVYLSNSDDPMQEQIDHSDTLLLLNKQGKLAALYLSPASSEVILSDYLRITGKG